MKLFNAIEFKVGALVIIIGGIIAYMSMQVSDDPSYLGRSKKAWFLLPNASGLIKGSAIRSAGIPIGVIKDIRLQDGKARIEVTVKSELRLTRSAYVEMKASGILGDKYIEIAPGDPNDPELESDGQIINVKTGGGLDDMMGQISEITMSLKDVAKNLNEAITNDGTQSHVLGRIVRNIEKLTQNFAEISDNNKDQISEVVSQLNSITKTVNDLVNDESDQGFKKTWKTTLARLDTSMKNIEDITSKINRGEGTIGKLISDEKTADEVAAAIEGLGGMLDTANRVSTAVDFHGYYMDKVNYTKSAIGIQIQPGLDRYYYLGIVTDPAGVVEKTNTYTTGTGGTTEYDQTITYKSKTKLTAYFAKNFYDFTVRGGLIENTGGVGFDYRMLPNRRLKASVDAFDFDNLQLRGNVSYQFKYGVYIMAGYNDILDKNNTQSVFGGAGLFLTNDDLKLLLTKSPF